MQAWPIGTVLWWHNARSARWEGTEGHSQAHSAPAFEDPVCHDQIWQGPLRDTPVCESLRKTPLQLPHCAIAPGLGTTIFLFPQQEFKQQISSLKWQTRNAVWERSLQQEKKKKKKFSVGQKVKDDPQIVGTCRKFLGHSRAQFWERNWGRLLWDVLS